MAPITPQQLTTINLKYGTTAKSLKTLAFADLSAKALFSLKKPQEEKEIAKKIAELIGVRSVSEDLIKKGLEELREERKAKNANNKWELSAAMQKEIEKEIAAYEGLLKNILDRHFPKNIDDTILAAWFTDAVADFFTEHGDEWVQSVCKGTKHFSKEIKTPHEILGKSIIKHKLTKNSEELKNSFFGFLSSSNFEDQRYITNVGYAMFSARLVAADVGADPIALEELREATFIADTNFLFALQLNAHRFAASLETLGEALQSIKTKLVYTNETEAEYRRVWTGRKAEILNLLQIYPNEVVIEAKDDFISTAVLRGCENEDDFETFFQSIYPLPGQLPHGDSITPVGDDEQITKAIEQAKKDSKLKNCIQQWCLKFRPYWDKRPKSNSALDHDASLIYITELKRKQNSRDFILTLDRSLQACTAERVGNHDMPSAICLEGLIQILAANNAGTELDATNFAPLLTSILIKRCVPPEQMYTPQDLHWLYSIQKNVASFRPEKIREIALEVTKARLAGKSADDEKLQRTVNRLYQEENQNAQQVVEESVNRARLAEENAKAEKVKRVELERKLKEKENIEKIRAAKNKLIKTLLWRIPLSLGLAAIVYVLVSFTLATIHKDNFLDFVLSVCTLAGSGYQFIKKPIKNYRNFKNTLA